MIGFGLGLSKYLSFGLGEYYPYAVYGLALLVALLCICYRSEAGILFIAFLLPIFALLNKTLKLDLPLAKDIIDILVVTMLLGWLFHGRKKQEDLSGHSPLLIPILLLMGFSLFSYFMGSAYLGEDIIPDLTVKDWQANVRLANWKNYMIMPLLYLISYYNLKDRKWKYALFILLFFSFLIMDLKFRQAFGWVQHTHYVEEMRLGGTFAYLNANAWGAFHAIYTLLIIGLFLVDKQLWRRIAYIILICGGIYSLMYSYSRGGYVGFLVGLFFIGIIRARKLLVPLIIFLLIWKIVVPISVVERVEGIFLSEEERGTETISVGDTKLYSVGRKHLWEKALNYFSENPIFGVGFGTFERLTRMDTHNVYFKTIAEQGLVGLLIYLWFYFLALRSGWRLYRRADEGLLKAFGFGFVCAVVGSMVVNMFGERWIYLQLSGLYWIFWALVDQENGRLKNIEGRRLEAGSTEIGGR